MTWKIQFPQGQILVSDMHKKAMERAGSALREGWSATYLQRLHKPPLGPDPQEDVKDTTVFVCVPCLDIFCFPSLPLALFVLHYFIT